jgi:hypothetical protein
MGGAIVRGNRPHFPEAIPVAYIVRVISLLAIFVHPRPLDRLNAGTGIVIRLARLLQALLEGHRGGQNRIRPRSFEPCTRAAERIGLGRGRLGGQHIRPNKGSSDRLDIFRRQRVMVIVR